MGAEFTSAITKRKVIGSVKMAWGTFTPSGGSTGGNINTGMTICDAIQLSHSGSSVVASAPVVNETLPIAGSAITIVTTANSAGYWFAIGK